MKQEREFSVQTVGARLATFVLVGVLAAACSKENPPTAAKVDPAVRGEAIRGEPIAVATAKTETPVPAAPLSVKSATTSGGDPVASEASVTPANPSVAPGEVSAVLQAATAEATKVTEFTKEITGSKATKGTKATTATPATATTATVVAATAKSGTPDQPMVVGFDKLGAFQYALPDGPVDTNKVETTKASAQIPETVKSLNNQFVSLKGFMMPLKVEKGLVTELLIMRDQSMCCYGAVPRINEWVSVKMVGNGVKPVMDQAVTMFGKLKVGEMYENGYLVGIYSLDGERMAGPLDL